MRREYVRDNNFWEAPTSLLDSRTRKFITGNRMLANLYMRKKIGTGQETSLRLDPWLSSGGIVDQIGRANCSMAENPSWKVSRLIHNNP